MLGYLAQFASFRIQSEVLCTQGLTHILQTHKDARTAMAAVVKQHTGVVIDDSLTWIPEAKQADGARPDLEARTPTAAKTPFVKIEAKLGAQLFPAQLHSYARDLLARNPNETALLVLVDKGRMAEAADTTVGAFQLSGPGPLHYSDGRDTGAVFIAIISWDELFAALKTGEDKRFRFELEQLQAMYRELSGDYIAPLASVEELAEWRSRAADFINLVDQATRRLTRHHKLLPLRLEPFEPRERPEDAPDDWEQEGYKLRYVCASPKYPSAYYSIGVRDSFAEPVTPVWMRFHKDTDQFRKIRKRIAASKVRSFESGGHVWIPLDVPVDVPQEQMVQSLVGQAEDVVKVAFPDEWRL